MTDAGQIAPPPKFAQLMDQHEIALFLDFDGTLVPIASTPDGIVVPEGMASRLSELASRLAGALAVVSGRSIADLETHIGQIPTAVAGSHGADRRAADGSAIGQAPEKFSAETESELAQFCASSGASLERKSHGGAIHFRADPAMEGDVVRFATELAERSGLSIKRGKCVVELTSPGASKAGAVEAFLEIAPFAGRLPIFIGDDVTDEDGFRAAAQAGGFGIRVGDLDGSIARYNFTNVQEVHAWLSL